jgi:hypothetical protein
MFLVSFSYVSLVHLFINVPLNSMIDLHNFFMEMDKRCARKWKQTFLMKNIYFNGVMLKIFFMSFLCLFNWCSFKITIKFVKQENQYSNTILTLILSISVKHNLDFVLLYEVHDAMLLASPWHFNILFLLLHFLCMGNTSIVHSCSSLGSIFSYCRRSLETL